MILESKHIKEIEDALTALGLKDKWEGPMIGMMAVPPVANFHGAEWDKTQDDFQKELISSGEFAKRQIALIHQYGSYRYRLELEKELTGIFAHQIGEQRV